MQGAFAERQAGMESLAAQGTALRASVAELQSLLAAAFPDGLPGGVKVTYDDDNVIESVTIDEAARPTQDGLQDAFAVAFASAPVPRPVLALLISDASRMAAIREHGQTEPTPYSDAEGIVTLLCVQGRPVGVRLGAHALAKASYAEIAARVVQLARLAVTKEAVS